MSRPMARLTVVVPCYNEAARLDAATAAGVRRQPARRVVAAGQRRLEGRDRARCSTGWPRERPGRIAALQLTPNRGKAEAVRAGAARRAGGGRRDRRLSRRRSVDAARGGRRPAGGARPARHPGRDRRAHRHARVRHPAQRGPPLPRPRVRDRGVDDPAGARLRHAVRGQAVPGGPALSDALATPFLSRWAFDVEFLGRLLIGTPAVPPLPLHAIVEVPLPVWHDVKGSKLGSGGMARTLRDLALVATDMAARRRAMPTAKILRRDSFFARRNRLADTGRGG